MESLGIVVEGSGLLEMMEGVMSLRVTCVCDLEYSPSTAVSNEA